MRVGSQRFSREMADFTARHNLNQSNANNEEKLELLKLFVAFLETQNYDHGMRSHGREERGMRGHGREEHGMWRHGREEHGMQGHGREEHGMRRHGGEKHGMQRHGREEHGMFGRFDELGHGKHHRSQSPQDRHDHHRGFRGLQHFDHHELREHHRGPHGHRHFGRHGSHHHDFHSHHRRSHGLYGHHGKFRGMWITDLTNDDRNDDIQYIIENDINKALSAESGVTSDTDTEQREGRNCKFDRMRRHYRRSGYWMRRSDKNNPAKDASTEAKEGNKETTEQPQENLSAMVQNITIANTD